MSTGGRWLLVAAACWPGAAETGAQQLTPAGAAERALAAHPSAAAAEAAVARAGSVAREARSARLPSLAVDGHATRFEEPMVVAPLHGFNPLDPPEFDRTLWQGGVTASYTLFDGGARGARIGRAAALEAAAERGAEDTRGLLLVEVADAYLRVRSLGDQLEAQRARVTAVAGELQRARQLWEQGRAAQLLPVRAEAALAGAAADTVGASAQLLLSARRLARLMGDTLEAVMPEQLAPVRALPPSPTREEARVQALRTNAVVARARAEVAAAERGVREARAALLPRVQTVARYTEYGSGEGRETGEWQAGLQLAYAVFTGGARGAAQDRAAAELGAAGAALRLAELRVADAVDAAWSSLEAALARVEALGAARAATLEVARIERLALTAGAGVQTDYLAAEAEVLRTTSLLSDAWRAAALAHVELAHLTGVLDVAWLRMNLGREP